MMGLYKDQNKIAGSYMLPRADDNRQVNVSRKRMHKKKRRKREERRQQKIKKQGVRKVSIKEAQVYLVFDSGACDI
jgi:hypothetical protein